MICIIQAASHGDKVEKRSSKMVEVERDSPEVDWRDEEEKFDLDASSSSRESTWVNEIHLECGLS